MTPRELIIRRWNAGERTLAGLMAVGVSQRRVFSALASIGVTMLPTMVRDANEAIEEMPATCPQIMRALGWDLPRARNVLAYCVRRRGVDCVHLLGDDPVWDVWSRRRRYPRAWWED